MPVTRDANPGLYIDLYRCGVAPYYGLTGCVPETITVVWRGYHSIRVERDRDTGPRVCTWRTRGGEMPLHPHTSITRGMGYQYRDRKPAQPFGQGCGEGYGGDTHRNLEPIPWEVVGGLESVA